VVTHGHLTSYDYRLRPFWIVESDRIPEQAPGPHTSPDSTVVHRQRLPGRARRRRTKWRRRWSPSPPPPTRSAFPPPSVPRPRRLSWPALAAAAAAQSYAVPPCPSWRPRFPPPTAPSSWAAAHSRVRSVSFAIVTCFFPGLLGRGFILWPLISDSHFCADARSGSKGSIFGGLSGSALMSIVSGRQTFSTFRLSSLLICRSSLWIRYQMRWRNS
jgi:hypothetical protein